MGRPRKDSTDSTKLSKEDINSAMKVLSKKEIKNLKIADLKNMIEKSTPGVIESEFVGVIFNEKGKFFSIQINLNVQVEGEICTLKIARDFIIPINYDKDIITN